MIRFACPTCSAVFTVADDKAGKTSTCPKCKSQFQIPELDPPPMPPPALPLPPPAKRTTRPRGDEEDDDRPRRRSRRDEEDDDDRPRRRSRRDEEDEDDDRPRRRSRREDDDEDDRPRRRSRRDDDDDYDRRPRKKAPKRSGLILAAGIVSILASIAIVVLAGIDISKIKPNLLPGSSQMTGQMRQALPDDVRSALNQIEAALVFLQIYVYSAFLVGLAMMAGGTGLTLHMTWGRIVGLIAAGLAAFSCLCLLLFFILLYTVSIKGSSPPMPSDVWLGAIVRVLVLAGPAIFLAIVLMNSSHTRFLRSKF